MPVTGASSYWVILGHTEGPTGGRSGSPTGNHILGVGYTGYIGNEKNGNGNGNGRQRHRRKGSVSDLLAQRSLAQRAPGCSFVLFCVLVKGLARPYGYIQYGVVCSVV